MSPLPDNLWIPSLIPRLVGPSPHTISHLFTDLPRDPHHDHHHHHRLHYPSHHQVTFLDDYAGLPLAEGHRAVAQRVLVRSGCDPKRVAEHVQNVASMTGLSRPYIIRVLNASLVPGLAEAMVTGYLHNVSTSDNMPMTFRVGWGMS